MTTTLITGGTGKTGLVGRFGKIAVALGTVRLVLLSGLGEQGAQHAEQSIIDSGAEWTVLRCAFFAQNFSESTWVDDIRAGRLELPGDTYEPILDTDDIAEVAFVALTQPGHVGQLYELNGPRLLTFAEAVHDISEATDPTISFNKVTGPEFASSLTETGMPIENASSLADLFTEVLNGHNAHLADGVRRALGREPRDFSDFVRRTAQTGVWDE